MGKPPKKQTRKRLKPGTVIGEWQDGKGQWWQTVVVKDTGTVFKSTAKKIERPSEGG
jgi:hypothetical protein